MEAHGAPDHDPVHSPSHYTNDGGIECIDAIEAALGPIGASGFRKGNAIKYIWRAGKKGAYVEDLEKARWYLDREIEKATVEATATRPEPASVGSANEEDQDSPHPLARGGFVRGPHATGDSPSHEPSYVHP